MEMMEENLLVIDRKIKLKVLQYWINERKKEIYNRGANKTNKDIIDLINHDLNYTLMLFKQQIKADEYLSYIIAGNRVFLDYEKLGIYLRKRKSNLHYLNNTLIDFIGKIQDIINLHNVELKDLEQQTRERNISSFLDFEEDGFSTFTNNFKCLRVNDFTVSWVNLSTRENRIRFATTHEYVIYDSHDFARRCNHIMQRITSFLELNSLEEVEKKLAERRLKLGSVQNKLSTEVFVVENDTYRSDIFKNYIAFQIYNSLHLTYQDSKSKLADYSYIYHKMKFDNLIHRSVTNATFLDFLCDEGIEIDKIKALKEIGKKEYRELAYSYAKDNMK